MSLIYNELRTRSDSELLTLIIRENEAVSQLLRKVGTLADILLISPEELQTFKGVGPKRAMEIYASFELARRVYTAPRHKKIIIKKPEDIASLLMTEMRIYDREHFRVLYLDRKGGLITMEDVSVGGLHSSLVHPREVFKTAIRRSAASVILVHNHPSGDAKPSQEDVAVTRQLLEASRIIGIEVLDHLIIGDGWFCSLKSENLI